MNDDLNYFWNNLPFHSVLLTLKLAQNIEGYTSQLHFTHKRVVLLVPHF